MNTLVDIGLNLAHDSFDHDRDEVLLRAEQTGVRYMIVTGSTLESTRGAIELAYRYPNRLRATAGVHPHHASELRNEQHDELRGLILRDEVVAIGECGLDFFRNFSSPADQERAFLMQLELATKIAKPLFLHQRDAHALFVSILKEYLPKTVGGVAHCFTEDFDKARDYLDLGLYVGITGWLCDERRGQALREAVRRLPLDRMVIETDAPYLLPRDLKPQPKSRRNEPMYLSHVLATLAALRNEDASKIAAVTTANASKLFGWPNAG